MQGNKTISFKSSGLCGDLLYALAGIKEVCKKQDAKAEIYMWLDQQGHLYEGAQHPRGNNLFSQESFDLMKPLMMAQDFVESFKPWKGEPIICDLDVHFTRACGMPYGSIPRWYFYCFPDMACDLGFPWLDTMFSKDTMVKIDTDKMVDIQKFILINRTSRYHAPWINYFFLKKYESQLMFTGLSEEHQAFCKEWNISIPLLVVKDFYELAVALKSCRFFLGNQSMCYAIAEAMKIPRILESCEWAPNVIPYGPSGVDFRNQGGLEYYFTEYLNQYS